MEATATTANPPPEGVTPRVDALLRLGQAALELGAAGNIVDLSIHELPRPAFDALPGETHDLPQSAAWVKNVPLSDDGFVRLTAFTREPPAGDTDWFEIAKRITRTQP